MPLITKNEKAILNPKLSEQIMYIEINSSFSINHHENFSMDSRSKYMVDFPDNLFKFLAKVP